MTAINSAATGNWNDGATWSGGLFPGSGDTATILNGHHVTVSDPRTIGLSGASSTTALTINAGGHLTIAAGQLLKVRGDVVLGNASPVAALTLAAGAILEFDGVAAPASTHYALRPGYLSTVTLNGTAGARCLIRSSTVGKEGSIAHSSFRWDWTGTYFDFLNLGTSSIPCVQPREGIVDIANWIFDACGEIQTFYEPADLVVRYLNGTMKNSVGTYCINHGNSPVLPITTGTRVLQGCVFDKQVLHTFGGYTIADNLFSGDPPFSSLAAGALPWASFSNNLLVATGNSAETATGGAVVDGGYYLQNSTTGNPHYFSHAITTTVRGMIFEYTGTTADGDCNLMGAPTGPITITIEHCLGLPNAAGGSSGTMFSHGGSANLTTVLRHNTWFGGGQVCCNIGETYAGHAGMIAQFRDNLCWDTSPTAYKLEDYASSVNDVVAAASCHHNAGYNLILPGSNGKSYHNLDLTGGAPGASDVDGTDPLFVDRTRDFASWDGSIAGGAGSVAHGLAELKKKNDASGYNPSYTITALCAYVKGGFIPGAAAHHAASDSVSPSNGWIGALEGSVVTPPTPPPGWTLIASVAAPSTDGEDIMTPAICTATATLLVAVVGAFWAAGVTTVQDSKTNTWTPRTIYSDLAAAWLRTYYVENPIVSAAGVVDHTFTTVGGPGNYPSICVLAFSGAKLIGVYDVENGAATGASSGTIQAGSGVTPTEANELVIAGCMARHALNITGIAGGGFTSILLNVGAASLAMRTALAYSIQTAAVLTNPTWTYDAAGFYGAANLTTFKGEPVVAAVGDLGLLGIG